MDSVDVVSGMLAALDESRTQPRFAGPRRFGLRLACAAAAALGTDAVTLSVSTGTVDVWYPIGASDAVAAQADDQQVLLGYGPALHVQRSRAAVHADPVTLDAWWPQFAGWLASCTGFRSVTCVPVPALTPAAVLTAYHGQDKRDRPPQVGQMRAAGELIAGLLHVASLGGDPDGLPVWMRTPEIVAREQVSVAVGMLAEQVGLTVLDASALLRAYCFAADRRVDDVAADLVNGRLPASTLRPDSRY